MKITSSHLARPDSHLDPVGDAAQNTQRMRVGMIGLAAVLLLIGLAAALFATVSPERQVAAVGAANADVVANMVSSNSADAALAAREPLAELGVAPSAAGTNAMDVADNRTATPVR